MLKYGLDNFAFVVLETVSIIVTKDDNINLLKIEDKYINIVKPEYNIALQRGNTFGYRHTEETKAIIKANYTKERRDIIGNLNRNKTFSSATIEKMQQAAINRSSMSDTTRRLVSNISKNAQLFEVSLPNNKPFTNQNEQMVTSIVIRTIPAVAEFIGCNERTVRRALTNSKPCRG